MHQTIARLIGGALLGAAAWAPAQAATVIDFEGDALSGVYLPGQTVASADGFVLTAGGDFGVVDYASALGFVAPSGNATQFYFASNDGRLTVTRSDSLSFSLDSFSAAFVPLDPPSLQTTVIVAQGTRSDDSSVTAWFAFAPGVNGSYAFSSYGSGLAALVDLKSVSFFGCSLVGSTVCSEPTLNNGQFAIDDISLTPVPEPASALLLAAGIAGLAAARRRNRA